MTRAHHTRLERLLARLNLQPGEGVRLGLMMLYSAAAFGGVLTTGFVVSSALFLSRLPASAVPYLFILPALVIIPSLLSYHRIAARYPFDQVALGSTIVLLAAVLVFRILLATPYGSSFAVLAALDLFIELASTLVIMQFWIFAGQLFNPREARRLFGLMALGGTLSNVAAGLSLTAVVRVVGAENLLFIVFAALLICAFCALSLGRLRKVAATPSLTAVQRDRPAQAGSLGQDIRAILASPLLLSIAGFTVLVALLVNVGAYQFFLALQVSYGGREEAMIVFLGRFEFFAGLAALVVQGYLASKVMRQYGIFVALLFFPLGVALAAALGLVTGGALLAMALIRAADPVFRRTINDAALNAHYLPAPAKLREQAKGLLEALAVLTYGVAGVAFLVMQDVPEWTYVHWGVPLIGFAAIWLVLLLGARRHYLHTLAENVNRRQLDLSAVTMDVTDEATSRVLVDILKHPDELMVLHALKLIAEAPGGDWREQVTPLLKHPSREVKLEALRYLELCYLEHGDKELPFEPVKALFTAPEEEVRAAALATYCALGGNAGDVTSYLHEAAPCVRGAAVFGLAKYGDTSSRHRAISELETMLAADDPSTRAEAARLIGALKLQAYEARLFSLLEDENLEVQRNAIRAAGALQSLVLLPCLLEKLASHLTAPVAIEAINVYGEAALLALSAVLEDLEQAPGIRACIPIILQRIGSLPSAAVLLDHLSEPDKSVRLAIYKALVRLRDHLDIALPRGPLQKALLAEIASVYALHVTRHDLNDPTPLLSNALKTRLEAGLKRVFLLLELRYPGELGRAYNVLQAGEAGERAMALELLDNLLDQEIKIILLPLFEASAQGVLRIAHSHFSMAPQPYEQRIKELATGTDPWLQVCAVFEIGALGKAKLSEVVLEALNSQNPLLRETALASCGRLLEPQWFQEMLDFYAVADPSPTVSRYARALLRSA